MKLDLHSKLHILVTDVWTDRNKGDLALNLGVMHMLRKCFPSSDISVCSLFGANQMDLAIQESFFTRRAKIRFFVGGLFPTYHVVDRCAAKKLSHRVRRILLPLKVMCSIGFAALLLLVAFCKMEKVISCLLPNEFRRSLRVFSSADVIVSRRSVVPPSTKGFSLLEPYFVFKELYHAYLAIIMRKPLVLFGYSIWPLNNPFSRKLVRFLLMKSVLVTLREELSYKYARQLDVDMSDVHVLPDLSFAACTDSKEGLKPYPRNRVKPAVGFAFVDWETGGHRERENYVDVMANFIKYVTSVHNCKISVVSQVVYPPQDPCEIAQLIATKSGSEDIEFACGDFSLDDLLALYSHFDLTVATPLHSGIFSLCKGTPAILIAYDGGPKHVGVMKMLGMEDCVLPYDRLNLQSLIKAFDKLWSEKLVVHEEVLAKIEVLRCKMELYDYLLKDKLASLSLTHRRS